MSIRRAILETSPFRDLVRKTFPNSPEGPEAFTYSLEGYLRWSNPNLAALDGFIDFAVLEETTTAIRIVATTWFLPNSYLPFDGKFQLVKGGISYQVLLGSDDTKWNDMTRSERSKAINLYAREGKQSNWRWNEPLEGWLQPQNASRNV